MVNFKEILAAKDIAGMKYMIVEQDCSLPISKQVFRILLLIFWFDPFKLIKVKKAYLKPYFIMNPVLSACKAGSFRIASEA